VHAAAAVAWIVWPAPRKVSAAELRVPPPELRAPPAAPPPPETLLELTIIALPDPLPPPAAPAAPAALPQLATAPPGGPLGAWESSDSQSSSPAQNEIVSQSLSPAAPSAPQISTGSTPAAVGVEPRSPSDTPRSGLSMRDALPTRLVVPDLRKIAESGSGAIALTPRPPVTSEELSDAGGGRKRSDQGTFVAEVARDGTVELKDRPNLRVGLAVPSPRDLGRGLASWYRDPYAQTRDRERERERQRVPSGAVDDEEEQRKRPGTVPILSGSFDLTDWAMRMAGRDPYLAAKLSFLDRTREARAEMATAHRAELLRKVPVIIREHLARLWAQPEQSAAARRAALFELWDECEEDGDASVVEATAAARSAILGFIRGRLPAGSAEAYSEEELAALNQRRRSRQRFRPYQDPPPAAE
jgi:hypothetical protein